MSLDSARFSTVATVLVLLWAPLLVRSVSIAPEDAIVLRYIIGNFTGGILPYNWQLSNISGACDWRFMLCHDDGHIKTLKISPDTLLNQQPLFMNSTLPSAVALLPRLEYLDLVDAGFYGTLPAEIFTDTIISVNLGSNFFTGAFPKTIANATRLNYVSIYENIFTSLPVPEMLAYVGKSAVVAETDFAFSRNSLNCSSFHPGFFNKRAELDPVCDLSFATLPADANGNICGFAQIPEGTSLAGCRIRPSVQASFTPSPRTAQFWGFQSQHIRVEVQGTRVSFYGIMRNGTVFRDEFVAIDFFGVSQMVDVPGRASILVDEAVLVKFTAVVETSPGIWNISSNIMQTSTNNTISFSVVVELSSPKANGGVKFTVVYKGLLIVNRSYPTEVSLPVQVLIKAPIAGPSDALECNRFSISNALSPQGTGCQSAAANIVFKAELDGVRLQVKSQKTQMDFETPFFFSDLRRNITNYLFYAKTPEFYFLPHGNINLFSNRRMPPPPITSLPSEQALAFVVDLSGPAVEDFLWDPTVQLSLLFDSGPAPITGDAPLVENSVVNLGIAVGVPIAIVVVLGIILVLLLVPPVRRKFFGFEAAAHEAKTRLAASQQQAKPVSSSTTATPAASYSPPAQQQQPSKRGSTWEAAKPAARNSMNV